MKSKVVPGRFPEFKARLNLLASRYESITDFAFALGISRQTVGFWLNGNRVPDADSLITISREMNVSVDWLLGLSEIISNEENEKTASQTTGLCSEAISLLNERVKQNDIPIGNIPAAVNFILSHNEGYSLLMLLYGYLCCDGSDAFIRDEETGERKNIPYSGICLNLGEVLIDGHPINLVDVIGKYDLENIMLYKIMDQVKDWKKKIKEEEAQKNGKHKDGNNL